MKDRFKRLGWEKWTRNAYHAYGYSKEYDILKTYTKGIYGVGSHGCGPLRDSCNNVVRNDTGSFKDAIEMCNVDNVNELMLSENRLAEWNGYSDCINMLSWMTRERGLYYEAKGYVYDYAIVRVPDTLMYKPLRKVIGTFGVFRERNGKEVELSLEEAIIFCNDNNGIRIHNDKINISYWKLNSRRMK